MRYTRLKKAVESGAFRGATLSQPQGVSAQMVELANPEGRRTASLGGRSSSVGGSTVYNSARKLPRRRNKDDQQEEDEDSDDAELRIPAHKPATRKRKAANAVEGDEDENLFFPDTFALNPRHKQVKRSESDEEVEEVEDEEGEEMADSTPTKSAHSRRGSALPLDGVRHRSRTHARTFRAPASNADNTSSLSPSHSNVDELDKADGNDQQGQRAQNNGEDSEEAEEQEDDEYNEANPVRTHLQRQPRKRYVLQATSQENPTKTRSTRKKQSAQEAAESAFARRIATGEIVPDASNIQYFAAAEQAARLGFAGYSGGSARPASVRRSNQSSTMPHNINHDQNYAQGHEGSEDGDCIRSSFSGFSPSTRGTTSFRQSEYNSTQAYNYPPNTSTYGRVEAADFAQSGTRYGQPRLSTNTAYSNYGTPASILEGFQPPTKKSSFGTPPTRELLLRPTSTNSNLYPHANQRRPGGTLPAPMPSPSPRPTSQQSQRRRMQPSPRIPDGDSIEVRDEDGNVQEATVGASNSTAQFGLGSFLPDTTVGYGQQSDLSAGSMTDVPTSTRATIEAAQSLGALRQEQGRGHEDDAAGRDHEQV